MWKKKKLSKPRMNYKAELLRLLGEVCDKVNKLITAVEDLKKTSHTHVAEPPSPGTEPYKYIPPWRIPTEAPSPYEVYAYGPPPRGYGCATVYPATDSNKPMTATTVSSDGTVTLQEIPPLPPGTVQVP